MHPNIPGYHAVANIKPVNASSDDFIVNPCNLARARCLMSWDARTKYGPYWCRPRLCKDSSGACTMSLELLQGCRGVGLGQRVPLLLWHTMFSFMRKIFGRVTNGEIWPIFILCTNITFYSSVTFAPLSYDMIIRIMVFTAFHTPHISTHVVVQPKGTHLVKLLPAPIAIHPEPRGGLQLIDALDLQAAVVLCWIGRPGAAIRYGHVTEHISQD